jgi:Flp pilus assembly protein TadG
MSHSGRILALAGEERGAVLVLVALFAPVAIILAAFTIDAGGWFLHKRHLQVQADAGALAAAQAFQPCNSEAIYKLAGEYGGASTVSAPALGASGKETFTSSTPLYNLQTGGTTQANIHEVINSQTYFGQSTPLDGTASTAPPCTSGMVDVKLTENGLPWYFRPFASILNIVPAVNAHARVEIREKTTSTGSLPVAVNDFAPRAAEAYFVDESVSPAVQLMTCGAAKNLPCSTPLTKDGTFNGQGIWDNEGAPLPFAVNKANIGVRIAVSGRSILTGTMATDCQPQNLVSCYDGNSAHLGLLHIQGYSGNATGTVAAPIVRQVQLSGAPGGCSDGYFANPSTSCQLAITATVNWGTATRPTGADVDAMVNGLCYALTFQSSSGTNEVWSSATAAPSNSCSPLKAKEIAKTGYVPLGVGAGALQINLRASDSSAIKEFSAVQRSYAANSAEGNSGPVQQAFLGQVGGAPSDADSFRMCETGNEGAACTPNLLVKIYVRGSLRDAQSVSDPIYTMRFSGTGSQNQSISCPAANGGTKYADTLASGCSGSWGINATLTCPDSNTPTDCVPPATGNMENQVPKGLNQRILGAEKPSACTKPNLWNSFTFTNGVPNVSATDPRVVTVFVTPFGSFGGSGSSSSYPIAQFASFYITGWEGQGEGFNNPCQGNGDDTAQSGTIVGHFIKYTTLDSSGSGTTSCEPNSLGQCVAVLTR